MIYINKEQELTTYEWDKAIVTLSLCGKLKEADSILIKPNFAAGTYVDPRTHCVSDLSLLSKVIELVASTNDHAVIYIAESDSTGNGFAYLKFQHLGIPDSLGLSDIVAERVKCLDLTRDILHVVDRQDMQYFSPTGNTLCLSETLCKADFIISLCNLKAHSVTGYTGACKNLFGCLPDFDKSHYHPYIHKVIHDLVLQIQPDLSIIDGFYAMEGNGPVHGKDKNIGYRIISDNALEADYYGAKSVGLIPERIGYINRLKKTTGFKGETKPVETVAFRKPGVFLRCMNKTGLVIQRIGQSTAHFGHKIHTCNNIVVLGIAIARPLLIKTIGIEKLKKMKRKIMK